MFFTKEIRWFFAGPIPPTTAAWFNTQVCGLPVQPPRTDFYLRLAEGAALGIKLRQGRIEVKQREGAGTAVQIGAQAAGLVESWCKWSFELAETGEGVTGTDQWIGVWKLRRWCLFGVGENGRITPALPDTIPEQGCACELTAVRLVGAAESWWSLGFESFGGTTAARRESLFVAAEQLLGRPGAPSLPVEQSYSYPQWLQLVCRPG